MTKKSKQSGQSPQHFNPWTIQESKGLSITLSTETHRLALYLQDTFKGWDVDCEYNRNRYDTKKLIMGDDIHLKVETTQTDDEQGKTVYPDIIVHRRGTDHNLLVSEVKKTISHIPKDFDLYKLREYKHQLGYSYALFLNFITGSPEKTGVVEEKWI